MYTKCIFLQKKSYVALVATCCLGYSLFCVFLQSGKSVKRIVRLLTQKLSSLAVGQLLVC